MIIFNALLKIGSGMIVNDVEVLWIDEENIEKIGWF